jgi:1,4-dihydroxy-2-naphthoate octaprenyltransferase
VGAAWVAATAQGAFAWVPFIMALIGGLALQLAANTFNDYYDWRSGADPGNNDYFLPFSGGSRSIELRLVKPRTVFRIGVLCSVIATACGVGLVALGRTGVLAYGVFGLFAAWAYTAPPLRLVARRGLGELLVGLCFGPLMVAGVVEALTGRFDPDAVLLGLPIGMLITAVLWINEFPDHDADVAAGKIHLVAVLGKPAARWGYATLVLGAFILLGGMTLMRAWPLEVLAALTALPVGVWAVRHLIRHWADRELVRANAATIGLHFATGLLIAGGLALS